MADDVRGGGDSAIDTDTPGRVSKTAVINSLRASGDASYDRARETLKGVSVDASGKVELEDWVEVLSTSLHIRYAMLNVFSAQCQAQGAGRSDPPDQGREGHRSGLECKR